MNFRDAELLSAFLDGQLTADEAAQLERRLTADANLRLLLDDLRVARGLLKKTPRRKAPRNFTLNPTDPRVRAPRPLAVPILRYAGALASVLFLFSVATNSVAPRLSRSLAAAPTGYGMGGGPAESEPVLPPEALAAAPAGTPAAEMPLAQDNAAPTAGALAKGAPPAASAAPSQAVPAPPIPSATLMLLALAAILAITLSWYLDRLSRRNFRSRYLEK